MTDQTKTTPPTKRRQTVIHVGQAHTTEFGREIRTIVHDGKIERVITSQSSAQTMDEAVEVYHDALKRLADR